MSESASLSRDQVARLTARLERVGVAPDRIESEAPARTALPQLGIIFFSGLTPGLGPYELLIDVARYADEAGFNAIWTPERHFTEVGGAYPNPAVLGAALAMITEKVRIRAGSVNLPLHDVLRAAEEWALVDNLSGGRVDLALAPGWHARDFVLNPQGYENRSHLLNQAREQLQDLWRGTAVQRKDPLGDTHEIVTFP